MANINENFVVQTGLQAGSTVIDSATGDITSAGNVSVSKTLTVGPATINAVTGAITTTGAITATGNITTSSGSLVIGNSTISGSTATFSSATISGGSVSNTTINGSAIGATTPSTGKFTTLQATGNMTVSADILPTVTNVSNIGSATNRFNTIFVNEARLSTNTLYIGDTAILGTDQNVVQIQHF